MRSAAFVLLLVSLLGPTSALAQGDEARVLFEQALEAIETGRFAEARDTLRRSIALYPTSASVFNLAIALRGTGEVVESARTFEALLRGEHGELSADQRAQVETLHAEVVSHIATLEVSTRGARDVSLHLDASLVELDPSGSATLPVDPGAHVVSAEAPGMERAERHVRLERGGRARVELELTPLEAVHRSEPILSEPVFWVVSSVLAAAIAASVIIGVAVYQSDEGLIRDPIFGNTETLVRF